MQPSRWGRESWLLCFAFLVSCDCCVALPRDVTGLSAVCDCGISRSYSIFGEKMQQLGCHHRNFFVQTGPQNWHLLYSITDGKCGVVLIKHAIFDMEVHVQLKPSYHYIKMNKNNVFISLILITIKTYGCHI